MAKRQPAPTWAEVTIINEVTKQPQFSPVWLNWFLTLNEDLGEVIESGGGSGPIINSNFTISTDSILGRDTAGTGALEEISFSDLANIIAGFVTTHASHGQCYLSYASTTTIKLERYRGPGGLIIDGAVVQVPSAGVTGDSADCYVAGVSGQTLAASTLYQVYAFMNGAVMTLDFITGGSTATDSNGVVTRSGDSTRTLVGYVYTNGSGGFTAATADYLIRSWFNSRPASVQATASSSYTASASYQEISSTTTKIGVVVLPGERVIAEGIVNADGTSDVYVATGIGVNSTTTPFAGSGIGTAYTYDWSETSAPVGPVTATGRYVTPPGSGSGYVEFDLLAILNSADSTISANGYISITLGGL